MAKKQKLLFKPTPISRLFKMTVPFKMVGDPPWNYAASGKSAWESRARAVYPHMLKTQKQARHEAGIYETSPEYAAVMEAQTALESA